MAANIHTHNFRQCSHTSVGLAQASPNYVHVYCTGYVNHLTPTRMCRNQLRGNGRS